MRGPASRRIAVIQIPRAQVSRLGTIRAEQWLAGPNTTALNAWTPLYDLTQTLARNNSSLTPEEWQAQLLREQSAASEQTPGTLSYTPAPSGPSGATISPPWSRWSTSGCNPQTANGSGVPAPASIAAASVPGAPAFGSGSSGWLIIAGILGAAASLMYLKQSGKGNR